MFKQSQNGFVVLGYLIAGMALVACGQNSNNESSAKDKISDSAVVTDATSGLKDESLIRIEIDTIDAGTCEDGCGVNEFSLYAYYENKDYDRVFLSKSSQISVASAKKISELSRFVDIKGANLIKEIRKSPPQYFARINIKFWEIDPLYDEYMGEADLYLKDLIEPKDNFFKHEKSYFTLDTNDVKQTSDHKMVIFKIYGSDSTKFSGKIHFYPDGLPEKAEKE